MKTYFLGNMTTTGLWWWLLLSYYCCTPTVFVDGSLDPIQIELAARTLALSNKRNNGRDRRILLSNNDDNGDNVRVRPAKLMPNNHDIDLDIVDTNNPRGVIAEEPEKPINCDQAFFRCLGSVPCDDCFFDMKTKQINWAGVTKDTDCDKVIDILQTSNTCQSIPASGSDRDIFCTTFKTCVYFDDNEKKEGEGEDGMDDDSFWDDAVDCNALTTCDWPGMHKSFLGDGICQNGFFDACYNTAICNYDGGDCCEDTCVKPANSYMDCGSDGFACVNPNSTKCDPTLSLHCPPSSYKKTNDDGNKPIPLCTKDETLYRLVMYDSFGDGWEDTKLTITATSGATQGQQQTPKFSGGLKDGSEGTEYICLSINPSCYDVEVSGGNWGREASWYIRGYAEGSPAIASGGGLMKCEFTVAGGSCTNTCLGKGGRDPSSDPDYKEFKDMSKCIDEKCMIQKQACLADTACQKCFVEDIPDYCFSVENFLAVTDCSICECTEQSGGDFCKDGKQAPGILPPSEKGGKPKEPAKCTPAETQAGGDAVLDFSRCMGKDKASMTNMLMNDFDENNFGDLDKFESCAHAYNDIPEHGGHTASSCMQILVNAMIQDAGNNDDSPSEAIAQLATLLYNHGQSFCDCAKTAADETPLCPSFYNFKTLLYESLDACKSLDQIDCAAWDEFQKPCKNVLTTMYGNVDFTKKEQCDVVRGNCGGAFPFPSFRRLDCQKELPADSWDFYTQYSNNCVVEDTVPVGTPTNPPTPQPAIPPALAPSNPDPKKETKPPTPYQPVKPSNIQPTSGGGYTPPTSDERPSYKPPEERSKKRRPWLRNMFILAVLGGIGYYLYKRQADGFNFVRYRRMNRGGFMSDDDGMYSGLALESSTNFEPPTLPPTPMSMPNNGGYGA